LSFNVNETMSPPYKFNSIQWHPIEGHELRIYIGFRAARCRR
jgi:hypothetical protein